jgi:SAM-dependent methyltransferase
MKTALQDGSPQGNVGQKPGSENAAGVSCPICGTPTVSAGEKWGKFARRLFQFRQCPACYFSFVADPWTDYAAIYDGRYYRGEGADPYVDYYFELEHPEDSVRRYEWEGIITAVQSLHALNAGTRWLDFGCGNGGQVRHVTARIGCDIAGTDTGEIVGAARDKGIRILDERELSAWDGTCDVVTAIEVLEHLTDPLAALRRIRALLKPGGLFFYTTGNARPFRQRITAWSYALPEIHVSFFEPETMVQALRATGFRPEFRESIPGLEQMIRFKILKRLGFRRTSPFQQLVPWGLIVPFFRRKLEIGALPVGWAA